MSSKYLMLPIDGDEIESLAKVLGNKTCKKILEFLAETKEASEKDISDAIKAPINTVEYNLKMLIHSGLIEKSKTFFWSQKGKKIPMYKVSRKSIVISPKHNFSKLKAFLPTAAISVVGAFVLRQLIVAREAISTVAQKTAPSANDFAASAGTSASALPETIRVTSQKSIDLIPVTDVWAWFLLGALFAVLLFILLNWRKFK